jgi:hypothetical protein
VLLPPGVSREKHLKPTPHQPQVLRIAAKSLIQGVPGTPSPGGGLEKETVKPTLNQPHLRIAAELLIQGVVKLPQSAPSVVYSGQIVDPWGFGYPFPGGWLDKAFPKSAPTAAYSGQIVDPVGAGYPFPGVLLEKASRVQTPPMCPKCCEKHSKRPSRGVPKGGEDSLPTRGRRILSGIVVQRVFGR